MNTLRLNITVPIDIGRQLKGMKNISAFIAEALREKLQRKEHQERIKKLQEAYRQSAAEEKELVKDWDATAGDGL
jgi:hypothetical protein